VAHDALLILATRAGRVPRPAAALLALALLGPVAWPAAGQEGASGPDAAPPSLESCARIDDPASRLACYDRAAGRAPDTAPPVPAGRTPDVVAVPESAPTGSGLQPPPARPSFLSKFWELDAADKRGVFNFTGYRPNFLLPVHLTNHINRRPESPAPDHTGEVTGDYKHTEAKIQISLRTKLAEGLLLPGADLWAGYTQVSLWQVYDGSSSSPFRSTDYEPELMYVLPTPAALRALPWGWQWRYGMLALAHQSNGQSEPLSRSWNRAYAAAGFERGDLSLVLKLNDRFDEKESDDDNPDLTHYRGRGELQLAWATGRSLTTLQWRSNLDDWDHGSLQLDWSYPLDAQHPRALRWYVQLFTGYGETLLDYNFRQTTLGLGLTLFEF